MDLDRSIVNDDINAIAWDAPACQLFGATLIVSNKAEVLALTDSTGSFLGAPDASLLIGLPLREICPPLYDIWSSTQAGRHDPRDWSRVEWQHQSFDVRILTYGTDQSYWLIDVWPSPRHPVQQGWANIQEMTSIVRTWLEEPQFDIRRALQSYREWLGFDVAAVCTMDEDGMGRILYEDVAQEVTHPYSLLGMRLPLAQRLYTVLGDRYGETRKVDSFYNVARNVVDVKSGDTLWWKHAHYDVPMEMVELSVCRQSEEAHSALMEAQEWRAALLVPLLLEGQIKGMLLAYHSKPALLGGLSILVARTFAQTLSLRMNEHTLKTQALEDTALRHSWSLLEAMLLRQPVQEYLSTFELTHGIAIAPKVIPEHGGIAFSELLSSAVGGHHVLWLQTPDANAATDASAHLYAWLNEETPVSIEAGGSGIFVTDAFWDCYASPNSEKLPQQLRDTAGLLAWRLPDKSFLLVTRHPEILHWDLSSHNDWTDISHIYPISSQSKGWDEASLANAKTFLRLVCVHWTTHHYPADVRVLNGKTQPVPTVGEVLVRYDAVFVCTRDFRLVYVNHSGLQSMPQHWKGHSLYDLFSFDDVSQALKNLHGQVSCEVHWIPRWSTDFEWQHREAIGRHKPWLSFDGYLSLEYAGDASQPTSYYRFRARNASDAVEFAWERTFLGLWQEQECAHVVASEHFRSELDGAIEVCQRDSSTEEAVQGLVVLIDVDGTKILVEQLGQERLDQLMQHCMERLRSTLGFSCSVSHLGVDEFGIIVPRIHEMADAWLIADSVMHQMSLPIMVTHPDSGQEVPVRLSAGVALAIFPEHGDTANELLLAADNAMYAAKRAGRSQIRMHDPASSVNVSQKFHLVGELRRALQNSELRAFLQPQFHATDGRIVGAEALVRWEHPDRGLLGPREFIDVAETSGLIDKLGEWVLHDTLRQIGTWPEEFRTRLVVSVNASVRQLRDKEHFLSVVDDALKKYGILAKNLEIEITETIQMGPGDVAVETLHALRARGVSVALDDFGTGYSNIAYLPHFPVDKLKFDRSLVLAGQNSPHGKEILRTLAQLAFKLNMRVLAEGVENDEQEAMLLDAGIEYMQGFKYAKPMPERAFLQLLLAQPRSVH